VNNVQLYGGTPFSAAEMPSASFNNDMAFALASGDPRYQMKQYDRAGFSRGGAQRNQAGIQGAQDLANGIASAYQNAMQQANTDAMNALQWNAGQEQYAQALGGLQQQNAYANQMAQLQRQQALLGLLG
jgi:uncharacterized protein YbjQ (UPF0145 family)